MPLLVNGVEPTAVIVNGVAASQVNANGIKVWPTLLPLTFAGAALSQDNIPTDFYTTELVIDTNGTQIRVTMATNEPLATGAYFTPEGYFGNGQISNATANGGLHSWQMQWTETGARFYWLNNGFSAGWSPELTFVRGLGFTVSQVTVSTSFFSTIIERNPANFWQFGFQNGIFQSEYITVVEPP